MKQLFKKSLSLLLSMLMVFSVFSIAIIPASAAVGAQTRIAQYFARSGQDWVWYDTVTQSNNALQWQVGSNPAYKEDLNMTYLDGTTYLRIANENLFSSVNQTTGVTFAFNYRPEFTGHHRHLLSIGKNAYGGSIANHFYISGATAYAIGPCFPVVGWVDGNSNEHIKAYPDGVNPVRGREYNIIVSVDYNEGVVFYIDGVKKNTIYTGSNLSDQLGNIRAFLNEINTYKNNYIGRSRWTGDANIEGYLSDFRIYASSTTEVEADNIITSMATADMGEISSYNASNGNGLKVIFTNSTNPNSVNESDVDFIDTSDGKTYYIKIVNNSSLDATITGIANSNYTAFGSGDTLTKNGGYKIYHIYTTNNNLPSGKSSVTNLTETTGANKYDSGADRYNTGLNYQYYHIGDVYDFSVTYKLSGIDTEFKQPAYIGTWNTKDDSKNLTFTKDSYNNTSANVAHNGVISELAGRNDEGIISLRSKNSTDKTTNLGIGFEVAKDSKAIIYQTYLNENRYDQQHPRAETRFQMFIDTTGMANPKWQDIGFTMSIRSWSNKGSTLNSNDKDASDQGWLELTGETAVDTRKPFSITIADRTGSWPGGTDVTTTGTAIGVINGQLNKKDDRRFTPAGNGNIVSKDNGQRSYFGFVGDIFTTDSSKTQWRDDGEITSYTGGDTLFKMTGNGNGSNGTGYQIWTPGASSGHKDGFFDVSVYFYVFDKTLLKSTVKEAQNAGFVSGFYTRKSWNNYMTALERATAVLAAQKTDQYLVDTACSELEEAMNNLTSYIYFNANGGTITYNNNPEEGVHFTGESYIKLIKSGKSKSAITVEIDPAYVSEDKGTLTDGEYTVSHNDNNEDPNTPSFSWEFMGWNKDPNATNGDEGSIDNVPLGGTLYAIWSTKGTAEFHHMTATGAYNKHEEQHTFYYDDSTGASVDTGTVNIPNVPDTATKSSTNNTFVFQGWTTNPWGVGNYTTPNVSGTTVKVDNDDRNVPQVYALYKDDLKLTYNANTTSDVSGLPGVDAQTGVIFNYNASKNNSTPFTVSTAKPERTGYEFMGWSTNSGANNTVNVTTATLALTQNTTLYAVWQAEKYNVTFDANGGTRTDGSLTANVTYATSVTPPTVERDGFSFAGWYYAANNTTYQASTLKTSWNIDGGKSGDSIILIAKWSLKPLDGYEVVVDFGQSMTFDTLNSFAGFTETKTAGETFEITATANDNFVLDNDTKTVTYKPTTAIGIDETGVDAITYTVSYSDSRTGASDSKSATLTVIPASVVYYEDSVLEENTNYVHGVAKASGHESDGRWTVVTNGSAVDLTSVEEDIVHGYNQGYADSTSIYSGGSIHKVTVSKYNNPNIKYSGSEGTSWPYAEFTFAGTGFDVVGLTSNTTGVVNVQIYNGAKAEGAPEKSMVVDTYYGYTYEGGEWKTATGNAALYQIPVISKTDLDYGTYTVRITPTYTSLFDHTGNDSYDFYIDGIRIYNPAGDYNNGNGALKNETVINAYAEAGQLVASEQKVRDILISAKSLDANNAEGVNGVVYIAPGKTADSYEDYSNLGPKNEVYLAKDQAIAFELKGVPAGANVQISAHALNGTATKMTINKNGNAIDVKSGTTLYYDITDYVSGNNNVIVIQNTGDELLSICNIRVTIGEATQTSNISYTMSPEGFRMALAMVNAITNGEPETDEPATEAPETPEEPTTETPETPDTPDTPATGTKDSILSRLLEFIRKIINMIKSVFGVQ